MSTINDILAEAHRLAEKSKTWADLSNALFDPLDGLVAKRLTEASERASFRRSGTYKKLHKLVEQKMKETGVVAGAEPKKSGRFVVRLPTTLHAALEHEAVAEGTSLNQLVLAKLAARLSSLVGGGKASIIQALGEVRDGYSADRVVADPQLDRKFLRRCRELGLAGTDYELNWALLNARKSGLMSDLPSTKRSRHPAPVRDPDQFEYASELAVRHLQQLKDVSLDQIICDPDLATEFDDYAARLAPGHTPVEYRWMALGLRKAGRLQQKKVASLQIPELQTICRVPDLSITSLPVASGLYLFTSSGTPVFLSQTDNLRHRIERHMEVSGSLGLPEWLWDQGPLDLSMAEMPGVARATRQTAEIVLVKRLHPILNFQRAA
jgi:site-specific DNA-methyltransferase (adenine-specific)